MITGTYEEKKIGICGLCGGSCVIEAHVKDQKICSVKKAKKYPCLEGKLCVRGAALKQYIHHEDRIQQPMKRVGPRGSGQYQAITWEQALNEIAQRLIKTKEESGAKSTVFYAGHPKWYRKVMAELAAVYGSPNFCTESSTCFQASAMAWKLVYGGQFPPDPANCNTYMIWSGNPAGGTGGLSHIRAMRCKGTKVIVVDPRVTGTASAADLHLQLYPGTDGALALALAHVILREGWEDRAFIEKYTYGFEEYKAYVQHFSPARAAEITGVSVEDIEKAARWIAQGKVSIQTTSCSIVHSINGVQNQRAVLMLLALTGSFDREGGNHTPIGPRAVLNNNHHQLADRPIPEQDITAGEFPVWNEIVCNEAQCTRLADVLLRKQPYEIRNLIMVGMNPQMWPRPDKILTALENVEFSVVVELFWNEACARADIILPCCAAPERDHVVVGKGQRLVWLEKIIEPGKQLPDVEILLRLAHAMGLHGELLDLKDYDAYLDYTLRPTGLRLDELKAAPEGLEPLYLKQGQDRSYERGLNTPSGKVEFVSQVIARYDGLPAHHALPVYEDWREKVGDRQEYPLILVSGGRKTHLFHSRTYRMPWLSRLEPHTLVEVNPEDAKALGLADGEEAKLSTPVGNMTYTVATDHGIKRGLVHIYHDDGAQNINLLIDDHYYDPLSGFPGYRSYICKLEKLERHHEEFVHENHL